MASSLVAGSLAIGRPEQPGQWNGSTAQIRSKPLIGKVFPRSLGVLAAICVGGKTKGRQIALPPDSGLWRKTTYFRLVIAVRSAPNFAMKVEPHQLVPAPPGLIPVTLVVPLALNALVKALQLPLLRSVSE